MADLTPGIDEQLVTDGLQLRLAALDAALVDGGSLDPADAHDILARHLAALARRALLGIRLTYEKQTTGQELVRARLSPCGGVLGKVVAAGQRGGLRSPRRTTHNFWVGLPQLRGHIPGGIWVLGPGRRPGG